MVRFVSVKKTNEKTAMTILNKKNRNNQPIGRWKEMKQQLLTEIKPAVPADIVTETPTTRGKQTILNIYTGVYGS